MPVTLQIDEALREIRDAHTANADLLDDLKDRLTGPQPIPLLPFVGAGLSMAMDFPGWGDFLKRLAKERNKTKEVSKLLKDGAYDEAAELVEQALSPAIFNKRIEHTFGRRASQKCELKGAVLALPELARGAVVTTNFDRILERVFEQADAPFEHVAWGSQVDSIKKAVAENRRFLLKVHGDAEECTDRVLTKSEYENHYERGNPAGLWAQLGRVFAGRTLLFVGCSLDEDRTVDVLLELAQQASGREHYAIVWKPASARALATKETKLGERGIFPIWYPKGRHDLIEPSSAGSPASNRPPVYLQTTSLSNPPPSEYPKSKASSTS